MASRPDPPLTAYRIADARHPIFDGMGAALLGGRWNSPGRPVIYASLSYACAMLERLLHTGTGHIPKNQQAVVITLPADAQVSERRGSALPAGWRRPDLSIPRAVGDAWLDAGPGAALIVPSVIVPYERNLLLNPRHPDFPRILASAPEAVVWDARLFSR